MSTENTLTEHQTQVDVKLSLWTGSLLVALAGVGFIGYGIVFLVLNFVGDGFELGVSHLGGITVTALSWFGVRQRLRWAWATAVVTAATGLVIALPMHCLGGFAHNWLTHLGPIYLATIIFVVGVALAYNGLQLSAA